MYGNPAQASSHKKVRDSIQVSIGFNKPLQLNIQSDYLVETPLYCGLRRVEYGGGGGY